MSVFAILFNAIPAVALIAVNKFLLSRVNPPLPSAVLLTLLHNTVTAIALSGFSSPQTSAPNDATQSTFFHWLSIMAFTAPSALSGALQSFALRVTPLWLFAVLRQCDLIAVAVIEALWQRKPMSLIGWLGIGTLAVGGVLCGWPSDDAGSASPVTFVGVASLALATVAHVMGQFCLSAALNEKSQDRSWRAAVELRRKSALVSILLKLPLFLLEIEVVDSSLVTVGAFFSDISSTALLALAISCALGVLVSVSHFIVMSDSSVLVYQVLAPLKFALTSVAGVLLFGDVLPQHKLLGVVAVLIGLAVFSTHRAR